MDDSLEAMKATVNGAVSGNIFVTVMVKFISYTALGYDKSNVDLDQDKSFNIEYAQSLQYLYYRCSLDITRMDMFDM